jgi:hypothetical protein
MVNEKAKFHFELDDLVDVKRGNGFAALNVGLSYGQGHTKPTLRNLGRFQKLADSLLSDVDVQRLASYQDGKSISYKIFLFYFIHLFNNQLFMHFGIPTHINIIRPISTSFGRFIHFSLDVYSRSLSCLLLRSTLAIESPRKSISILEIARSDGV